MAPSRCWRPELEVLEDRALAGTLLGGVDALLPALRHASHPPRHHLALSGQVSGTWTTQPPFAATGTPQTLTGSGTVRPLGAVRVSGKLRTAGLQVQGQTDATLTLAAARGGVTLQVDGPLAPGAAAAPPLFRYAILGGTRLYRHASGGGLAMLTETPERTGGCQPPLLCPAFIVPGQFTLTLLASPPPVRR
jgi:hypothetical protein